MKLLLTFALVNIALILNAQAVIVNSDGTHSHVINNGSTSLIVNSNGTHSTAFHNGNTSLIVNPNGTHSTAFRNGNTSVIVNPDGTHSTTFHNDNTSVLLNSGRSTPAIFQADFVRDGEETAPVRRGPGNARGWGRGRVVPESAFVDLSQWRSGPVIWVNVKKYKRKMDK